MGMPTELITAGRALCIGGGVGTAVVHPIAQGLQRRGVQVVSVIGGRSREWVIFEEELRRLGEVLVCTDDGSYGRKGFVTDVAREVLAAGGVDIVYAVGPVPMMRAVANLTRPLNLHTIVSLNPVMVDGTGMCGGCRVSVAARRNSPALTGRNSTAIRLTLTCCGTVSAPIALKNSTPCPSTKKPAASD